MSIVALRNRIGRQRSERAHCVSLCGLSTKDDASPVILGPHLDAYALRRMEMLSFDRFHLNNKVRARLGSFCCVGCRR